MKRHILLSILSLTLITFFVSCEINPFSSNNNQNIKPAASSDTKEVSNDVPVLTLDKIREKYKNESIGEIIKTYDYSNYILVEYMNGAYQQRFALYNLKTGDRDIMPLDSEANVFDFSSGDRIVFKALGINQLNGHKYFPYFITCSRVEEITGSEYDFYSISRDLYKPISEEVEFGVKSGEMISDLKVTLTGFEMEFSPQKGKEGTFYADYTTIPVMRTSYNSDKNQFLVELISTSISPELLKKAFKEQNRYINSIEFQEKGLNSLVIVNLKETGKFYSAVSNQYEYVEFPSVRFIFRSYGMSTLEIP